MIYKNWQLYIKYSIIGGLLFFAGMIALSAIPQSPVHVYAVTSGSMEPTLSVGSVVVVKKMQRYYSGDIVTIASGKPRLPVTHRIIQIEERDGQVVAATKGDANTTMDSAMRRPEQIIGRVIFHLPLLGHIFAFVQMPAGFVIAVIIPATIIVYHEILAAVTQAERLLIRSKRKRHIETDKKKNNQ